MAEPRFEVPDLTGKVILVTGASSGIGRAAALRLASAGATVLVHGRSPERTAEVAEAVGTEPLVADFAQLENVRAFALAVGQMTGRLDVLVHNAGALVPKRVITLDGHELTFQGNYLAAFLLQRLLGDLVTRTPGSRVVVTSSGANRSGRVDIDDLDGEHRRYRPYHEYATTKLEDILFVRELGRRLAGGRHPGSAGGSTIAVAVHPGSVATDFGAGSVFPGFFFRMPGHRAYLISPEEGAAPLVWLASRPDLMGASGLYFSRFEAGGRTSPQADDPELARRLWERSEEMVRRWVD